MPIAINTQDTVKYELKSLPEGYVVLKRMSFGQVVQRREMTKMSMLMEKGKKDMTGELALASVQITNFEFATCIVEHNLQKADGSPLNMSSAVDLQTLDPRVGQEIEKYITEMNSFEDVEGE